MMKNNKIDWIIHLCSNGVCPECGQEETHFLPFACNAHTHGMEKYGHPDFQVVLQLSPEEISYLLNIMGLRVKAGEVFHSGDTVSGIYENYNISLKEYEETGRKVLRIILPDESNHFPDEDCCDNIYKLQLLETDALFLKTP